MPPTIGVAWASPLESSEVVSFRHKGGPAPTAEAIFDSLQVSEVSVDVVTPKQYSAWIRGPVNSLVPHKSFRIWIQPVVGGTWLAESCNRGENEVLPSRELSVSQQRAVEQISDLWASGGHTPFVVERDSTLVRSIISPTEGAALVHGVSNLFGNRCIFMFIDDDPAGLRSAAGYAELLAAYVLLAARRVRELSAVPSPLRVGEPCQDPRCKITARELRILECVREGKSNQEIGQTLHISEFTVKSHLQRIFRKLGVANRTQAVATAFSRRPMRPSA